jgi:hypothetical protein
MVILRLSNLEEFEDTKGVIRILESVNQYRTDNIMTKRKSTKGQTTIMMQILVKTDGAVMAVIVW